MPEYHYLNQLLRRNLQIKKGIHFYFLRHGQSKINSVNSFSGWIDTPLSQKGHQQAHRIQKILSSHIDSFKSIHSSDLTRCKQTLNVCLGSRINSQNQISYSQTSKLRELNFGDDQGRPQHTFSHQQLKVINSMAYKAPNGESWLQVKERAVEYLSAIQQEGHHLVSTHGGLMCATLYDLGLTQLVPNCSLISAQFDPLKKDFIKINFEWRFPKQQSNLKIKNTEIEEEMCVTMK